VASTDSDMVQHLQGQSNVSTLGNRPGLRTWLGDLHTIPAYQVVFPLMAVTPPPPFSLPSI